MQPMSILRYIKEKAGNCIVNLATSSSHRKRNNVCGSITRINSVTLTLVNQAAHNDSLECTEAGER